MFEAKFPRHRIVLMLIGCLAAGLGASAGPADIPRILIVGDSWPASMQCYRSFDVTLPEYEGLAGYGQRGYRTTLVGIRASEYNSPEWLGAVSEELTDYPTIDIVHLCLGGNDFLTSGWNPATPPGEIQAFIDSVNAEIQAVIDHILNLRPNIRIALCGYTFVNQLLGGATMPEVNAMWVQCEQAKHDLAQSNPRVFYVHNLGLMQYFYGIPQADPPIPPAPEPGHVPFPGGYDTAYVPMPGGNPDYGAPLAALIDGAMHLTLDGYDTLARRCIEEFYEEWLSWPAVVEILLLSEEGKEPVSTFRVTFSEPVTGVDPADFYVTAVLKAPSVIAVNGSGAEYEVTVDLDGAPGTPYLQVVDDDSIMDVALNPLGGPGVDNGGFDFNGPLAYADPPNPANADFDACFEAAERTAMPAGWAELGVQLDPEVCDANGAGVSIDPPAIEGNGLLDSYELALIRACLDDESLDLSAYGGVTHAAVSAAWAHNYALMHENLGGDESRAMVIVPGVDMLMAGFMTLGDTMLPVLLVAAVSLLMELPPGCSIPNPAEYVCLGDLFGPDGDADGDGYTNREEYDFFVPLGGRAMYVMAALDPAAAPHAQCSNSAGGTYDEGDAFCVIVPEPVDLSGGFVWLKDGEVLHNDAHVFGTQWCELHIDYLLPSHSGVYECVYDGGTQTFGPISLVVQPTAVPVGGGAALAALVLAIALRGVIALRRS